MMENNPIERDDDEEEQAIARFPVWISTIRDYFKILIPILLVLRMLLDFQDMVFPPSSRTIGEIVQATRLTILLLNFLKIWMEFQLEHPRS